jgi:hypothetical protein
MRKRSCRSTGGLKTAKNTWGQPTEWCDYSGTVNGQQIGLTHAAMLPSHEKANSCDQAHDLAGRRQLGIGVHVAPRKTSHFSPDPAESSPGHSSPMKAMPSEITCCRRRTRQNRPWLCGLIAAAVSAVGNLPAANPFLPGADPHAVVVGDTVWIYPTWSDDRRGQRFFAFSSANWTDWRRHGPVLDLAEVKWIKDDGADRHHAWAPGVLQYLSNGLIQPIRMTSGPGNAALRWVIALSFGFLSRCPPRIDQLMLRAEHSRHTVDCTCAKHY